MIEEVSWVNSLILEIMHVFNGTLLTVGIILVLILNLSDVYGVCSGIKIVGEGLLYFVFNLKNQPLVSLNILRYCFYVHWVTIGTRWALFEGIFVWLFFCNESN